MENDELLRRAEDLFSRCERRGILTMTGFLSPAERAQIEAWAKHRPGCAPRFSGGREGCERTAAFFLPYDKEWEELELGDYIRAVRYTAAFGEPGHRDYLGAALALGIRREWLGDIWVEGNRAVLFCLPSVQSALLDLDRVGRVSVRAEEIALAEVPEPQRQVKSLRFTVMSPRLDAVASGMFRLSRSETARQIAAGNLNLNYVQCLKADAPVKEGDVISLRHAGKGRVAAIGGESRKGRLFVDAEIYQ